MCADVSDDQTRNAQKHNRVGPAVDKAGEGMTRGATKQRRPIRIRLLKVPGDRPGVRNRLVPVNKNWHPPLPGEGDRVLWSEAPGYRCDLQTIRGERHPCGPAIRTEPSVRFGARQIVQLDCHVRLWVVCHERRLNTTVRNCTRDEGGAFEAGSQVLASNHCKLLSPKAMVVSVAVNVGTRSRRRGLKEGSASEPPMKCRKRRRPCPNRGAHLPPAAA